MRISSGSSLKIIRNVPTLRRCMKLAASRYCACSYNRRTLKKEPIPEIKVMICPKIDYKLQTFFTASLGLTSAIVMEDTPDSDSSGRWSVRKFWGNLLLEGLEEESGPCPVSIVIIGGLHENRSPANERAKRDCVHFIFCTGRRWHRSGLNLPKYRRRGF